jgi:hypothetical protein
MGVNELSGESVFVVTASELARPGLTEISAWYKLMDNQNIQDTVSAQHQQKESPRTIFRPDAVRRYTQQRETLVLPRRVAMHTIVMVWIAFGSLIVGTVGIWMAHVPIDLSGDAIIVDQGSAMQPKFVLVAFLPSEAQTQIAPGQSLLVQLDDGVAYSQQTISVVEQEIISPHEAQRRYSPDSHPPITQPAAVAIAPLAPQEGIVAAWAKDKRYSIKVVVGTRRLIAFLPFFHRSLPE